MKKVILAAINTEPHGLDTSDEYSEFYSCRGPGKIEFTCRYNYTKEQIELVYTDVESDEQPPSYILAYGELEPEAWEADPQGESKSYFDTYQNANIDPDKSGLGVHLSPSNSELGGLATKINQNVSYVQAQLRNLDNLVEDLVSSSNTAELTTVLEKIQNISSISAYFE